MTAARGVIGGVALCAAVACTGGGGPQAPIRAVLAAAEHAPRVAVPWFWRGGPADRGVCALLDGDPGALGDAIEPAVLVIGMGEIRLGAETVLRLAAGRVPRAREGSGPLGERLTAVVARQRELLRACGQAEAPIDLVIAADPDVPGETLVFALHAGSKAGITRHFMAVAGAGGGPWRAEGFSAEEERAVLRWREGWEMDLGQRQPRIPLASLDALADYVVPGGLGCATLPLSAGPWAETVGGLDRLASFGARRFMLEATDVRPQGVPSVTAQEVELRVGGSVTAFPLVPLKFVDKATVPNWVDDGFNGLHPCEGVFVEKAQDPAPPPDPSLWKPGGDETDPWRYLERMEDAK